MDEQKHEITPLDYIGQIDKLQITLPELKKVKDRLSENLGILFDSLEISMQNLDSNLITLMDYWKEYGHNYDLIPELSAIPHLENAIKAYIRVTHKEKLLLVKGFIEVLETANAVKAQKEEEKKEKKEKMEKKDIDKKLDEMENQPKLKKGRPKKTIKQEIKEEDKSEFDRELEALEPDE